MTATEKPWMPSETIAVSRSFARTTANRPATAMIMIASSCSGMDGKTGAPRQFAKQERRHEQNERDHPEGCSHIAVQPAVLQAPGDGKGQAHQAADGLIEAAIRPPADGSQDRRNTCPHLRKGDIEHNAEDDRQPRQRQRHADMRNKRNGDDARFAGYGGRHRRGNEGVDPCLKTARRPGLRAPEWQARARAGPAPHAHVSAWRPACP